MIKIDRASVPPPATLTGDAALRRLEAARLFFGNRETKRKQKRFDFGLKFAQPDLRNSLRSLFHDKCGYCERLLLLDQPGAPYLDRFRPTTGAMGISGDVSPDAYWWLGFDWENMYACCAQCNRSKASRFPIESTRARAETRGAALSKEKPLLIDPCNDDPEDHLLFEENGIVVGKSLKGRVTVEVFNLNRQELVNLRAEEARAFEEVIQLQGTDPLAAHVDDAQAFTALKRQMLARRTGAALPPDQVNKLLRAQSEHERRRGSYSLSDPRRNVERERARTRYIEHVALENIGVHERLELSISSADSAGAPWMVLLGENGVGKSTILKAIAFALAGEEQWGRIGPYAEALLPRKSVSSSPVGVIRLRLSDGEELELKIDTKNRTVTGNAKDPRLYLLAFGATRLPPNQQHPPPIEPAYARLVNLFDPFEPLGEAVQWMLSLSKVQFERAGRTLKSLLDLSDAAVFVRSAGTVVLSEGGLFLNITTLSDGYQTIIGVGCDIMSVLLETDVLIEDAEGIVLIDEIGNHLHPTWRMRIVSALKHAFPRIQFIATTHEPLCLRGLENDEVAVLRKDRHRRVGLIQDLPPIKGLLVDQILSSPHFGLRSTVDPEFAMELDEYYELLAKDTLTSQEASRLSELEPMVDRLRLVGDSPREQILLRTIDQHLANADESLTVLDPARLPADIADDLMRLLAACESPSGSDTSGSTE